MSELQISEIQIIPIKPKDGLLAFVSFVLNSQFYVGNIALYSSPSSSDGYRLVYPLKILPNGKQVNCFHPINPAAGEFVKKSVVSEFIKLIEQTHKKRGER